MITDEQLQEAEDYIAKFPQQAAYQLATLRERDKHQTATLSAIRTFSQNQELATYGDKKAIEFALGGRIL
jgi:hypothetical protein